MSTIIACSACNHRFEAGGYRDEQCPACGAFARLHRRCPRCGDKLAAQRNEQVVIDACPRCAGMFLDHVSLELVLGETDHKRIAALLKALRASPPSSTDGAVVATCPTCEVAMQKKLSATGAGVVIDVCVPHGVFFDSGELQTTLRFVQRELKERAERREADERHARARAGDESKALREALRLLNRILGGDDK
jgi:Zn-finger nucleic acid-binding protein